MLNEQGGRRRKRGWTQAFKLAAVSRMNEGEGVRALGEDLGVRATLLYDWHRRYRSGGAAALRPMGRPSVDAAGLAAPSALPVPSAEAEQRRIEELERKIGQQQLDLDFFRAALRHVREQRRKSGGPGGEGSTR